MAHLAWARLEAFCGTSEGERGIPHKGTGYKALCTAQEAGLLFWEGTSQFGVAPSPVLIALCSTSGGKMTTGMPLHQVSSPVAYSPPEVVGKPLRATL